MSGAPWFSGGLRFRCTGCGDCCTGEPGAVWVNQEEIDALARHLGMEAADFEARYVRKLGMRRSLFEHFDGDCVFFDPESRGCRVYPARPIQCRTWPFWERNLDTPESWQETCDACPGSGSGDLVPMEAILARAQETRQARRKE